MKDECRVLVMFDTKRGQSKKIAEYVTQLATRAGHLASTGQVSHALRLDLATYDAAVLVAPIHYGTHSRDTRHFLRRHVNILAKMPLVFVSVSNGAVSSDPRTRTDAVEYAHDVVESLGLDPAVVTTAGGALAYPQYNPLLRWVMRRIAAKSGAPTDTSRTHELTVWSALDAALVPFFDGLSESLGQECVLHLPLPRVTA